MKNLIPRWYEVLFIVNWKEQQELFSTIETEERLIEADFNGELNDRFYWDEREIVKFTRIKTPIKERIPWLEVYYKLEEKYFNS